MYTGMNCQYDTNTYLKIMKKMKHKLDEEGLHPYLMCQPNGFLCPEAEDHLLGYTALPEYPFGNIFNSNIHEKNASLQSHGISIGIVQCIFSNFSTGTEKYHTHRSTQVCKSCMGHRSSIHWRMLRVRATPYTRNGSRST